MKLEDLKKIKFNDDFGLRFSCKDNEVSDLMVVMCAPLYNGKHAAMRIDEREGLSFCEIVDESPDIISCMSGNWVDHIWYRPGWAKG
jgi:hypothetical protein